MTEPIRISLIGSTGSVGRQVLQVVDLLPNRFEIVSLIAGSDAEALASQVAKYSPKLAGLAGIDSHDRFQSGSSLLIDAAVHPDADLVVNAVVGSRGLAPTLAALHAGKSVALANKESLVAGGPLVRAALGEDPSRLRPIDSEHAALAQALLGVDLQDVSRLMITASGGPFRERLDLSEVSVEEALAHPTWQMGDRITIDSATLMNKGLELIEAHHLFGFDADRLGAIVHPQSLVHAIVELVDGSQIMQAGVPDMKLPIATALLPDERHPLGIPRLDLEAVGSLRFEPIDHVRFPAVNLALAAMATGGTATAILNAADEEAVAAFLSGRIGFQSITRVVEQVLDRLPATSVDSVGDVLGAEEAARAAARALIDTI